MSPYRDIFRKDVVGWSLYDFANTIYSMNILSLYLKRWIVEDLGREGLYYDIAFSGSMLLTGILMPALGAISDHSGKKKLFLFLFTLFCCLSTGILPLIPLSAFALLLILFSVSNFFYEGGMVFYNSLLYSVAEGERARLISGVGVAWGYLGSIVGMILVLPAVTGTVFGLKIPGINGYGKAGAFLPTAVFFFLFSIPLFLWVKEQKNLIKKGSIRIKKAYQEVWQGIKETGKYPGVMRFIVADYFFEDAVATVILNIGIFSSLVLGFSDADLTVFLIISTLSAMVGSFLIGKLSQGRSLKRMMSSIIWGWLMTLGLFVVIENQVVIYLLGSALGIFLGGLWTVSRPLLAERVPREELGRFFGLYSLSGRAAAVLGPIIWGVTVYIFSPERTAGNALAAMFDLNGAKAAKLPYRCAVISLMIMMGIGLIIFRKLPERNQALHDK
ncbi:MAG: MFS transporter [Candidatus Zixiibacteriota bacterium]